MREYRYDHVHLRKWRRRHAMSWSRSSINSLGSPSSPNRPSMRALQVSKPPTLRPLPPFPTLRPRRRV
jgi:hypothetical protein